MTVPGLALAVDALRPTLFTAARRPEQATALLLADLMSPGLWSLLDKATGGAAGDPGPTIARIRRFVDTRFMHATRPDFSRLWGLLERDRLVDSAERDAVDVTLAALTNGLAQRVAEGDLRDIPVIQLALEGSFPLYVYPTVDGILAHKGRLKSVSSRLLGLTSCLDECVLVGALAVASGAFRLDDLAFLGSPYHYALLASAGEETVLVNAKKEGLDAASFRALLGSGGDAGSADAVAEAAQREVDSRLPVFDRIVTPRGSCVFPDGPRTLLEADLEAVARATERIFGIELRQVREARSVPLAASRSEVPDFAPLEGCRSAQAFEEGILALARERPGSVFDEALHVYRHPAVVVPEALAEAALKGYFVFLASALVSSPAEAAARAAAVKGTSSIFGDSGRVALPDEVLVFDTGTPTERRLLAWTLARLAGLDVGDASSWPSPG